jgi:Flp pilus assembly protein CpaB
MFRKGGRSLIVVLVLGGLIFVFASMFFASLANNQPVVVAKVPLSAGTRLTPELLEVKQMNAADALPGAFTNVNDLKGQLLVSARMPGDQITQEMVGDRAISAVAASLPAGHVAVALKVSQDTGLAGIVRVGDKVGVVGIVTAQDLGIQNANFNPVASTSFALPGSSGVISPTVRPTPTPSGPNGAAARVALRGLTVLVVPQTFRYEETAPAGSSSASNTFVTARTTTQQQQNSVIVLAVPLSPIEIIPGYVVSPVELLTLLNDKGKLHFFLEPTATGANVTTPGLDAQELLQKFYK